MARGVAKKAYRCFLVCFSGHCLFAVRGFSAVVLCSPSWVSARQVAQKNKLYGLIVQVGPLSGPSFKGAVLYMGPNRGPDLENYPYSERRPTNCLRTPQKIENLLPHKGNIGIISFLVFWGFFKQVI